MASSTSSRRPLRRIARWSGAFLALIAIIVVALAAIPVSTRGLGAEPEPTGSYDEAVDRFEASTDGEDGTVYEPCESILLDHGERTDRSIVLFHGLTNCPKQFRDFGQHLHDQGYNVLVLRAPRHGLADPSGDRIGGVDLVGDLSAEELQDYADESIDIAAGLGDQVDVLGLSMGGVLTAWAAQYRSEVDRAVVIAPAMSIPRVPGVATAAFTNLANRLPDLSLPGASKLDHAYAGESSGALAAMFLLARKVEQSADDRPANGEVVMLLNPDDDQVDLFDAVSFGVGWGDADGEVDIDFLPAIGLPHDVIDEDQPDGDVTVVYPVLSELLGVDPPAAP
jgi:pimeloyl-ACP methyl ester carboxylesterase